MYVWLRGWGEVCASIPFVVMLADEEKGYMFVRLLRLVVDVGCSCWVWGVIRACWGC